MREQNIVGLDIGTSNVRCVVAQFKDEKTKPQILGIGQIPSFGLRRGAVVDVEEAVKGVAAAIEGAERTSGFTIEDALVNVGGSDIEARQSKGVIAVSRADGEISREDTGRAVSAASAISLPQNREIIHILPQCFTVDGQDAIKDPVGMSGVRLEVDVLLVDGSTPYLKNLRKCLDESGIESPDLVAGPLAAASAVLSKRQKELGALVLDIGGGTTGLAVFEEGEILHTMVLPVGGASITNDIAILLRTSVDVAEKVKMEFGTCLPGEVNKKEMINLEKLGGEGEYSKHEVAEIIEARVAEMAELVNGELKKIDREGLLPAGVILVGGGAKLPGLCDLFKEKLKLPAQVGFPSGFDGVIEKIDDPSFATAAGLILWAFREEQDRGGKNSFRMPHLPSFGHLVNKIKKGFRGFMP